MTLFLSLAILALKLPVQPIVPIPPQSEGTNPDECKLVLGSVDNVVVIREIMEVGVGDPNVQIVHDVVLKEGNRRVTIVRSVVPDAKLPFPIDNAYIHTVQDTIGTCIQWPKDWIMSCLPEKKKFKAPAAQKEKGKRLTFAKADDAICVQKLSKDVPESLKTLAIWASNHLVMELQPVSSYRRAGVWM